MSAVTASTRPCGDSLRREHFLSPALPVGTDSQEAFEVQSMLEAIAAGVHGDPLSAEFRGTDDVRALHSFLLSTGFLESAPLADWFIAVLVYHLRCGGSVALQLDLFRRFLIRRRCGDEKSVALHLQRAAEQYAPLARLVIARDVRRRQLTELCLLCDFLEQDDGSADEIIAGLLIPLRGNEYSRYFHATLLYFLKGRSPELFASSYRGSLYATMLFLQIFFQKTMFTANNCEAYAAQAVTPDNDLGTRLVCLFDELARITSERRFCSSPAALFEGICAGYRRMLDIPKMSVLKAEHWGAVYLADVFARTLREEVEAAALSENSCAG